MARRNLRDRSCGAVLVLIVVLSGCAKPTKREIEIDVPTAVQPANGTVVSIGPVVDRRSFVPFSEDPSVAQLITGGETDPSVTSRVLAQCTKANGDRLWDFLLPEGTSVAELVRAAMVKAFRKAGFVVVEAAEDVPSAIPVSAEILRFWSWNTGYWTATFHFATEVSIQAGVPSFENARTVSGSIRLHSAVGAGDHSFINTTTKGLEDFVMNLQRELEADRAHATPRVLEPQ